MFFLFVVLGMSSRTTLVNTLRAPRASGKLVVSPSVTKCDLLNLGRECAAVVDGGAEWLHFSVQDGRFTSKLTVGSPIVSALRAALPDTVFDVKLGVLEPERRVPEFVTAGADIISVHPESTHQLAAVLEQIRAAGCAAGVVLNPATPVSAVEHVLPLVDVLVVMCVSQGSKHVYLDEACRKVRALRAMCDERALDPWIEVDGGVSTRNCNRLVRAGATVMVAGGSIFSAGDSREAIAALLTAARSDPDHEDRDAARSRAAAPRDADRHWK